MNAFFLTILWVFVTVLAGLSILVLFDRKRELGMLEALGLSFPLGIGIISAEMFIIGFSRLQFNSLLILAPWIALFACNVIYSRSWFKNKVSYGIKPLTGFEKIAFSLISFEILYIFFRALIKPIEAYDSVAIYALKSKIIYFAGTIPPDFFTGILSHFKGVHPDYPLMVPLSEVWFYSFINSFNEFLVKAIFPVFFMSFLIVFYFLLKKILKDRTLALAVTFAFSSIKQVNDYAAMGVSDLILGIYFCLSFAYLYLWMENRKNAYYCLSLCFAILTLWTKNEGFFLVTINLFILMLCLLRDAARRRATVLFPAIMYFTLIAVAACAWLLFRNSMCLTNENFSFGMVSFRNLASNIYKVPLILYEYQKQVFGFKKWNLAWIILAGLFLLKSKNAFSNHGFYFTLAVIMFFISYSAVYVLSAVQINFFLSTTFSRFLLHILPVCILWGACLFHAEEKIEERAA